MFGENSRTLAPFIRGRGKGQIGCAELREATLPALVISGTGTHARYRLMAERLASCQTGARLAWLDGAHHDGASVHAEAVARMIRGFHREIAARAEK